MALDPRSARDRGRLSTSMDHWHRELERYRRIRRETVVNYVGMPEWSITSGGTFSALRGGDSRRRRVWGNLIQMSALAQQIPLSFADPRFVLVSEFPEGDAIAPRLQEFLNRYVKYIGLADTFRLIALDSFFGWGIAKTAVDILPPRARIALGRTVGPMVKRISQDNFVLDGSATVWDDVAYMGNYWFAELDEARNFAPFLLENEKGAMELTEFGRTAEDVDSRIHPDPIKEHTPTAMVRLVDVYFPRDNILVTWEANDHNFKGVTRPPLWVREYEGYFTGPFSVLSHLDVPDNLIPVPKNESTKALHFLFNELAERTSHQAKEAKVNPVYEIGSDPDMRRIEKAGDREPVGVSRVDTIGSFEKPGPSQSQTSYMLAALNMFKEFSGNLDATLGLGPTAKTASQSALIQQSVNAVQAEAVRRRNEFMEGLGFKIGHLALKDREMSLQMRTTIPGTDIQVDSSFLPGAEFPRPDSIDVFVITMIPTSMDLRTPEMRLQQLQEATAIILQAAQAVAAGVPIDLRELVEIQANYRDLPELRRLVPSLLPDFQAAQRSAQQGVFDPTRPRGIYTRVNQSERTNQGGLVEALSQFDEGGSGGLSLGLDQFSE